MSCGRHMCASPLLEGADAPGVHAVRVRRGQVQVGRLQLGGAGGGPQLPLGQAQDGRPRRVKDK